MKKSSLTLLVFLTHVLAFAQLKCVLSGHVTDAITKEPLIGATIFIPELKTGASTDMDGFYHVTIPEGTYSIQIQYLGYESTSKEVKLSKSYQGDFSLNPSAEEISIIEIRSSKNDANIRNTEMGVSKLDIQAIKQIPAIMGEVDIIKSVNLLPGVVSTGEGNGGFSVRGGSTDQNLVLLDNAVIFNPNHLFGVFSVFNSDVVKDATLYSGSIPAQFGGRLSSVLDVKTKEPDMIKTHVYGGVSFLSTRATVETPIIQDKLAISVSARRTYSDVLVKLAPNKETRKNQLFFYDTNTKINWKINEKNRITFSSYYGKDAFSFSDAFHIEWGNATANAEWTSFINNNHVSRMSFSFSNYKYKLGDPAGRDAFLWSSDIKQFKLKNDFSLFTDNSSTIRYGYEVSYYRFNPMNLRPIDSNVSLIPKLASPKNAVETAIYVNNEQKLSDKVNIQYGFRYTTFSNIGRGNKFQLDNLSGAVLDTSRFKLFEVIKFYHGLEPRFTLRYEFVEGQSFKVAYNRTKQYLHLVSNSSVSSPLDVWIPSDNNVQPVVGNIYSVGYFKNFLDNILETSVEVFFKDMQNVVEFKDNADLTDRNILESSISSGKGLAYGIEFSVKKNVGNFTGWATYTLSKSKRKIEGINNDKYFPFTFDRTHNFNLVSSYKLNNRVHISATWVFSTGMAVTFPKGKFNFAGNSIPVFSDRNDQRLANNHRLDVGLTLKRKNFEKKKLYYEWNFSVYNLYNKKNPFNIFFEEDDTTVKPKKLVLLGALPSVSWNFRF